MFDIGCPCISLSSLSRGIRRGYDAHLSPDMARKELRGAIDRAGRIGKYCDGAFETLDGGWWCIRSSHMRRECKGLYQMDKDR
jgi:hypothetical protein